MARLMKAIYLTTDDPLYLPAFYERVLRERAADTKAVYVAPPLYKRQSALDAAVRYARTFGPMAAAHLTARIVMMLGVALTLAVLPALTIVGFGAIALVPTLVAVAAFQVIRRAADYAVARPARELLYTVTAREDRYKAKSVIDTVIYRGGDQVGAWSLALLRGAGLGAAQVSVAAIPLAALWLVNALWLGRRQEQLAARQAGA